MLDVFTLKLIISFLAGGALITTYTLIAERKQTIGGAIISLPSTIAVSLFFIAWALPLEEVVEAINVMPASNGLTLVFLLAYVYFSGFFSGKIKSVVFSAVSGLLIWLVPVSVLGFISFSDLLFSLIIYFTVYFLFIFIAKTRIRPQKEIPRHSYTRKQILSRGLFCGFVVSLAVFLSKALGPIWGTIFAVFPAAYMSSMVILHWNYDSRFITSLVRTAPLGHIFTTFYALFAKYFFSVFGFVLGTLISYAAVMLLFMLTFKTMKRFQK